MLTVAQSIVTTGVVCIMGDFGVSSTLAQWTYSAFLYEPSRYDIGDGNGSVFDYVRSTCSHDEFIEALNQLETQLYFPGVTDSQRQFVENTVKEETQILKTTLKERMEDLDKAQNEYKELHKKWLIEATEADRSLLRHAEFFQYDISLNYS